MAFYISFISWGSGLVKLKWVLELAIFTKGISLLYSKGEQSMLNLSHDLLDFCWPK